MTATRVLLVGVGGQGILTMGRVLGEALMASGHRVLLGQQHGMSQRGGSVENTVLIGDCEAPYLEAGDADVVVGLEALETARAIPRMSKKTSVLLNDAAIVPFTMTTRGASHPGVEPVLEEVRSIAAKAIRVAASKAAEDAGDGRAANISMLGALAASGWLPVASKELLHAIERFAGGGRPSVLERAFFLGFEQMRNS